MEEEKKEIEVVQKRLRTLKPYLFKEGNGGEEPQQPSLREGLINQDQLSSSEDSDSDEVGEEIKNKPVDRTKKLTKTERNFKLLKRMRRDAQEELRKEKLFNKDINKLNIFVKEHEVKEKKIEEGIKKRKAEIDVERLR